MQLLKSILLLFYWIPVKYIIWLLPAPVSYWLVLRFSFIFQQGRARKTEQLGKAFDQISADRDTGYRRKSIKRAFWALLCTEYEMLFFPRLNRNNIDDFVIYKGMQNLDKALSAGKGAMLLFGHFGANQMIMPAIGYRGYTMSQLSAPATVWQEKMPGRTFSAIEKMAIRKRWQHEKSLPVTHINVFGSLKGAFRCLSRNEVLGVAIDGGGGTEKIAVNFLRGKGIFSTGAAEIARRTGCAVLPTFMERNITTGKNELYIEKAFYVKKESSHLQDKELFIQTLANRLELYVRQSPWLYMNFLALRQTMTIYGDKPFLTGSDDRSAKEQIDIECLAQSRGQNNTQGSGL